MSSHHQSTTIGARATITEALVQLQIPQEDAFGAWRKALGELELYQYVLDALEDGIYLVDLQRRIRYWGRGAERITGYLASDVVGQLCSPGILQHTDADDCVLCEHDCLLESTLTTGERSDRDLFLRHRDGYRIPVRIRAAPIRDASGRVVGAVQSFLDNTPVMAALELANSIQDSAFLDPLTEVGNRRFTEFKLDEEFKRPETGGAGMSVGFVDIDHFKRVNDIHGHEVGDQVLKSVAATIRRCLRRSDFIGRWGGEEFLFLLPKCALPAATVVAERCRNQVQTTGPMVRDQQINVTISIGLTCRRDGETWKDAVRRADQLMYQSKEAGRNLVKAEA